MSEQENPNPPWRDRIVDLRRVKASQLLPHPDNWRTHPPEQRRLLNSILADVGFAGAVLARKRRDGRLQLIDGHLRVEAAGDALVPVLVVDLDADEAKRALLAQDGLTSLASVDEERLDRLLNCDSVQGEAWTNVIEQLRAVTANIRRHAPIAAPRRQLTVPEVFQVVIECADEQAQEQVYQRMTGEGFRCRVLTL